LAKELVIKVALDVAFVVNVRVLQIHLWIETISLQSCNPAHRFSTLPRVLQATRACNAYVIFVDSNCDELQLESALIESIS